MNSTIDRLRDIRPDEFSAEELSAMSARITASPREIGSGDDVVHALRPLRRPLVLAGVGVAVAGAVVTAAVLSFGASPSRPVISGTHTAPLPATSTIKARLLSALDGASDDVVETRTVISDGQVFDRFANGDNTRSVSYDTGYDMEPAENSLVIYGPSGNTITVVYPATKTYVVEQPSAKDSAVPIAPPSIRDQIAEGVLTVVSSGQQIDGHDTIELTDANAGSTAGINHLWVDSSTYLPVRQIIGLPSGMTGDSSQTDWTYYPPSSASLAKLQLSIPPDYSEVSTPPTTVAP
jgi:hypothetical protein